VTVVAVTNVVASKVAVVDAVEFSQAQKLFWAFPCFLISSISVQMYQAHTSVGPIGSHYKIQGISIDTIGGELKLVLKPIRFL